MDELTKNSNRISILKRAWTILCSLFYLDMAKNYVMTATGGQQEYLILMVAGIAYEYRVSEDELDKALSAITPFIVQGVIQNAEAADE